MTWHSLANFRKRSAACIGGSDLWMSHNCGEPEIVPDLAVMIVMNRPVADQSEKNALKMHTIKKCTLTKSRKNRGAIFKDELPYGNFSLGGTH